jgi:hypothetical protein
VRSQERERGGGHDLENIARLQGTPKDVNEEWFRRSKELVVRERRDGQPDARRAGETAALDELYGLGYNYHDRFADRIKASLLGRARRRAARLTQCVVTVSTPTPRLVSVPSPAMREYTSFPGIDLTPKAWNTDAGGASIPCKLDRLSECRTTYDRPQPSRFLDAAGGQDSPRRAGERDGVGRALAASMGEMVVNYSVGKKGPGPYRRRAQARAGRVPPRPRAAAAV